MMKSRLPVRFAGPMLLALMVVLAPIGDALAETAAGPVLDRILKRGELIVGTAANMPPLNMKTKDGEIIGLEIDLAEDMASDMGVELKTKDMPFGRLLAALESGEVDMVISGMTITPQRNLRVAFVGPYQASGKCLLTKEESLSSVKHPSEINVAERTLTALQGSTSEAYITKAIPNAQFMPAKNYDEALYFVLQDKADALVADYHMCVVSLLRYPDTGLISVLSLLSYEPLGIALPANDPLLVNWVQNFLHRVEEIGRLEELKQLWFENTFWFSKLP